MLLIGSKQIKNKEGLVSQTGFFSQNGAVLLKAKREEIIFKHIK